MSFCSVCLDAVVEGDGRSTASLTCGHSFHLDCIGSAFNAKGRMQCPNCRGVEQGQWLYANACCLKEDSVEDSFEQETEVYNESLNHTLWCPHQGLYGHISLTFEELMNLGHDYADSLQSSLHGRRICPYLVGVHDMPRHSNHTENHMALHSYNLNRSLSHSGPRRRSHMHQVRSALLAHNGSWVPYRGSFWSRNQNVPNLHPNNRQTFSSLLEGSQSPYTGFGDGPDAGQHMHNHVDRMIHRHSHPHPVSPVRSGQTNSMRARHGEVSTTSTRHSPNYHIGSAQRSDPMHGHPSWGSPFAPQCPSMAPYLDAVHGAALGPHIFYGVPVYWWAWAPFETNHRIMASNPSHGGQFERTIRTTF